MEVGKYQQSGSTSRSGQPIPGENRPKFAHAHGVTGAGVSGGQAARR